VSGVMNVRRCGTCFFAKISPQVVAHDITKRVCFGAPPSAVPLPAQGGRPMTFAITRPVVGVSEDACALWRSKDVEDVERDDDAMRQLRMELETSETKQ
jgi:hypothetical protein